MFIDDAKGTGSRAQVNSENRLAVEAVTKNAASNRSEKAGDCYFFTTAYNYAGADTILWLSNSSTTKRLFIEKIHISSDTTTNITIHSPAYAAPAGTLITGVNANRSSGSTADAVCYQDETNNAQANVLIEDIVLANSPEVYPVDGKIILGFQNVIAVDFVTVGTLGAVTIVGYFDD